MATSTTHTSSSSTSNQHSQSQSKSESYTQKVLDSELLDQILSGLGGQMTDEEIAAFAENLLNPQLNAGLESAQQEYETAKLAKEQEIANLAQSLEKSIEGQNRSYRQSTANTEAAALARGMGRSSYTLQNLANQGDALAKAVEGLTAENQRLSGQIQEQITQAAEQNAQTQGRLKTDYAAQLAAKIQELRDTQRREWNQNYLTAISGAMGEKTTGTTTGTTDTTSRTDTSSTSTTTSGGGGSGGSGGSKKSTQGSVNVKVKNPASGGGRGPEGKQEYFQQR